MTRLFAMRNDVALDCVPPLFRVNAMKSETRHFNDISLEIGKSDIFRGQSDEQAWKIACGSPVPSRGSG